MQRDQGLAQPIAHITHFRRIELVLELTRELIGLPLKVSGHSVHENGDDGFEGG